MTDEERILKLRAGVEARQQDKAKAEVALAAAQGREQAALKAIEDEFGVSGLEAATALLTAREADLDQACAAAEAALREAGG